MDFNMSDQVTVGCQNSNQTNQKYNCYSEWFSFSVLFHFLLHGGENRTCKKINKYFDEIVNSAHSVSRLCCSAMFLFFTKQPPKDIFAADFKHLIV